jgi:predicted RND superfamily exporter protein
VLVPIEVIIGLMGWFGLPLNFGTALFGALIVGLGVDGSIHFLHYYHHMYQSGVRGERALRATIGHVGKAIVAANATTFCGFMVLMASKTSTLREFGIANSAAIFPVTLSVLAFLPALLTLLHITENPKNSKNDDSPELSEA